MELAEMPGQVDGATGRPDPDLIGTHRRIKFRDLHKYRSRDDLARRREADNLTELTQQLVLQ
ncbi:hypothetical protein [Frankia sp. CcWB3]